MARRSCRTRASWERFASGANDPPDVPLSIALSWHRCRDVHRIDPHRARPRSVDSEPRCRGRDGAIFAALGGIAATIADRTDDCVATITDGDGQVVATWGGRPARRRADDAGLRPGYAWDEASAGTNGVGTAIVRGRISAVRGPEHWSTAFHEWACTGVAFDDPVTGSPVATLTVSSTADTVPLRAVDLAMATRSVGPLLRQAARRRDARIAEAFAEVDRRTSGPLVALDLSAQVVAANRPGRDATRPGDTACRRETAAGRLGTAVATAHARARSDRDWRGSVVLPSPVDGEDEEYHLIPVTAGGEPIGFLASADPKVEGGEALDDTPARTGTGRTRRVAALGMHGRLVLLHVAEIRYAQAEGHTVWLVTDNGRLRAARRGIEHVEQELGGCGFLRVHRSYLVNVARVRDIAVDRGTLLINTAPGRNERIPVSRRCATTVRRTFGV